MLKENVTFTMRLVTNFHGIVGNFIRVNVLLTWIIICISQTFGFRVDYDYKRRNPTPSFISDSGNITYFVGSTANLSCVIENLGARSVIWRKLPDTNPLTIGENLFLKHDKRISISHDSSINNWDLIIKDLKTEDTGVYECQVASSNKNIRQHWFLRVKDRPVEENTKPPPVITIIGPKITHVGDEVTLNCSATFIGVAGIDWFFDGYLIESSVDEGIMIKERYSGITKTVHSTLTLAKAKMNNAGVYTCRSADEYLQNFVLTILSEVKTNNKKRVISDFVGTESSTYGQTGNTSARQNSCLTITLFLIGVTSGWIQFLFV